MAGKKPCVVIEISGGLISEITTSEDMVIHVVDYDNLCGSLEELATWGPSTRQPDHESSVADALRQALLAQFDKIAKLGREMTRPK